MALRNIRITGDSILEKVCKPVKEINKRTSDLIDDMFETMYDAGGVGLAAPQVTYVMQELSAAGLKVDTNATTITEAKNEILKALGRC